jgi:hypothetical protein
LSCRSSKRGKKSSRKSGEKQNGEKSSSSDSDSGKVRGSKRKLNTNVVFERAITSLLFKED